MTPGHNHILRLPGSRKLVKVATIASGNTCGARFWSDGRSECPMLPEKLWMLMHTDSLELFWEDECQQIDSEPPWEKKGRYRKVPFAADPGLGDYRRALDGAVSLDGGKRRYLLTHFWWCANDPVRHGEKGAKIPDDFREKLTELRGLVNLGDPEGRLTAAEIARELGEFGTAIRLLEFPLPGKLSYYARKFREWSAEGDASVREMRDDR